MAQESIAVEVAWALPDEQVIIALNVPAGSTVRQAIEQSGILARFTQIDLSRNRVGIFSRIVTPEQVLRTGDRVEIYRPLIADPKEARRLRAGPVKKSRRG